MDRDRAQLLSFADALRPDAERMLRAIARFAELALQEKRTSETLAAFLKGRGFRVERGIAGMDTAFRAEVSFGRGKPAVAFLCEMDALPGLGHACGHNLGGVASACAAAALARFGASRFRAGKVIALGTPAEETGYGKARMIEEEVLANGAASSMVYASSSRHALACRGDKRRPAPPDRNRGPSDSGNGSRIVPALQPNVPISGGERV